MNMEAITGFGLSVNCVLFKFDDNQLKTLILKRSQEPHFGEWALPGDLVQTNEELQQAAYRVIDGHTAYRPRYLKQTETYGALDRHPQGRVASVSLIGIIESGKHQLRSNDTIFSKLEWVYIEAIPALSFDHEIILKDAIETLKKWCRNAFFQVHFLPEKFTILDLHEIYTYFAGSHMDKSNFRRKMLSFDVFEPVEEFREGLAHRPAQFYHVKSDKWKDIIEERVFFVGI
jgi:8-oxo-dGTP diphosphatase